MKRTFQMYSSFGNSALFVKPTKCRLLSLTSVQSLVATLGISFTLLISTEKTAKYWLGYYLAKVAYVYYFVLF